VEASVVTGGVPGLYRVKFSVQGQPLVSVIIVNTSAEPRVADACADRVRTTTAYLPIEILKAAGGASAGAGDVDAAARQSRGAHLLFLDASIDPVDPEWLSALLEYSQQPPIGAVGGRIDYADGRLRHIGLLLGVNPGVARAMHGVPAASYGYFSSAIGVRNYSAVSGECLMTRRELFEQLGGFDALPWALGAVDYCLKARSAGLRVVFTPYARLQIRAGAIPASEPSEAALCGLRARYPSWFERDPQYNPNLGRRAAYRM
jgi:hypothetical protein